MGGQRRHENLLGKRDALTLVCIKESMKAASPRDAADLLMDLLEATSLPENTALYLLGLMRAKLYIQEV